MFQTLQSRDEVEGSGMGLAVIRKVMGHYHGEVSLSEESELGGATFVLTWPNTPVIHSFA
jgi:signal transduction histidine kinase